LLLFPQDVNFPVFLASHYSILQFSLYPTPPSKNQDFLTQDFPASPRSLMFSRRCPLSELEFLMLENFSPLRARFDSRLFYGPSAIKPTAILHRPQYSGGSFTHVHTSVLQSRRDSMILSVSVLPRISSLKNINRTSQLVSSASIIAQGHCSLSQR
jgi:hypothetical protein